MRCRIRQTERADWTPAHVLAPLGFNNCRCWFPGARHGDAAWECAFDEVDAEAEGGYPFLLEEMRGTVPQDQVRIPFKRGGHEQAIKVCPFTSCGYTVNNGAEYRRHIKCHHVPEPT